MAESIAYRASPPRLLREALGRDHDPEKARQFARHGHNAPMRIPTFDLSDWRSIVVALLATRIGLTLVGLAALSIVPHGVSFVAFPSDAPWLLVWSQWDAEHYIDIALDGYLYAPGTYSNISFFPLYPWLMRAGALALGHLDRETVTLVGFVISNVALFVALLYLVALVARDFGIEAGRRAVLYVLVFPMTFFLSAVYAESLFLATSVATLFHARRGEWYRAGIWGGLAAMTRPFGFLLVIPIAIEMYRQRPNIRSLPALAIVPAGLAIFFGYSWWRFGDALAYIEGNHVWGREFAWPWETLMGFVEGPLIVFGWPRSIVDLAFIVGMVVTAVAAWRLLPASYAAFASVGLFFTLSTGVWYSTPRHALALFPLFIVLAIWGRHRYFHWAWLLLSVVLAIGFMARFASGNWIA